MQCQIEPQSPAPPDNVSIHHGPIASPHVEVSKRHGQSSCLHNRLSNLLPSSARPKTRMSWVSSSVLYSTSLHDQYRRLAGGVSRHLFDRSRPAPSASPQSAERKTYNTTHCCTALRKVLQPLTAAVSPPPLRGAEGTCRKWESNWRPHGTGPVTQPLTQHLPEDSTHTHKDQWSPLDGYHITPAEVPAEPPTWPVENNVYIPVTSSTARACPHWSRRKTHNHNTLQPPSEYQKR